MGQPESPQMQARLKYVDLLLKKGMRDEAREQLAELAHQGSPRVCYLLAVLAGEEGRHREAAELLAQAHALEPGNAGTLNALGVALQGMGEPEQAVRAYQEALRVDPRFQEATVNLALLLQKGRRLSDAERVLLDGISLAPGTPRLLYNLANVLQSQGRSLDAVARYREVLRIEPDHLDARQNLLFALHYFPRFGDRQIFAEHLRAARTRPFRPDSPPTTRPPRNAGRIRVGYLSPDFRTHAVASFIEPVLREHDRERFEVFCYANLPNPDRTTERLRGLDLAWRDLYRVPDEAAAAMIERDGIEVLIDLAGHTSGNRLPLFARRPAPLQLTWIGYPDTTGLPQMDGRITDRLSDPPCRERYHTERLIRLPRSFCCYLPPSEAPELSPPPAAEKGWITFGSFNNLVKVNQEVIALWSRVLLAVPGSRFLLKGRPLYDAQVQARVLGEFRDCGVEPGRVELHAGDDSTAGHLAQYGRVDVALDTFPYSGTTTTCEALWMGVPVVTLAGERHSSRTGVSILTNCGLEDLIASTPEGFVEIAGRVARDTSLLSRFRETARERLSGSPLLDAAGVTRELEEALEGLVTSPPR